MATLLLDLVTFLETNQLVAGDGLDTFRDFVPEEPNNIVVLSEYAGSALSVHSPAVHRSVQVRVRNKNPDAARALCVSICNLFRSSADTNRIEFTGSRWGQVYVRQPPFKLLVDSSDRTTYCFNLGITTTIE